MELELPWPPSMNHYWRRVGAKTLISKNGRRFRADVVALMAAERLTKLEGPLAVEIAVYPPDRRRRDLDNLLKPLLDAMQHGGAYDDDSQIKRLTIAMGDVLADGAVVVRLEELNGDA